MKFEYNIPLELAIDVTQACGKEIKIVEEKK